MRRAMRRAAYKRASAPALRFAQWASSFPTSAPIRTDRARSDGPRRPRRPAARCRAVCAAPRRRRERAAQHAWLASHGLLLQAGALARAAASGSSADSRQS
ncbi:hypothetical protein FGB62_37g111 [Gracilaria domingensis]|nr:hypothetical protein FGB62_37g111 [Gracilaria domingensis]